MAMTHAWCRDLSRDEAVRASEDNRPGPLPTLEEAIQQAFGFDEASVQRACDETKTWPADIQAQAKETLADLLEQGVPRLQALAEASRWGKRLFEARYPEMLPKTGSASSALEHENKGERMGTKSEIQASAYRAEASEQPAPATPAPNGLRTERVTLEVTHLGGTAPRDWSWGPVFTPLLRGESVRVVEKADRAYFPTFTVQDVAKIQNDCNAGVRAWQDALRKALGERNEARAMRDTAIRERRHCRAANTLVCDERDALKARVAELEGQLESVADRAAAAETALESAPAASNSSAILTSSPAASGAVNGEISDGVLALEHMLYVFRDDQRPAVQSRMEKLRRLVELLRDQAPAESGAAETEPVAWGVRPVQSMEVPPGCASPRRVDRKTLTLFPVQHHAEAAAQRTGGTVVPLYAAPQPAKGWLTPEEREAVAWLAEFASNKFLSWPCGIGASFPVVAHRLLARSSSPEVVRPKPQVCGIFSNEVRDAEWIAALAAAGGKVKEVG